MLRRSVRLVRRLAGLVGGLVLVVALVLGGLSWRLARGPLDITGVARMVAARQAPALVFDHVTLALEGAMLRVTVAGLRPGDADDGPAIGEVETMLEAIPLLHGAVRPRDVLAQGVRLHVRRAADGRLSVQGWPGSFKSPDATGPPDDSGTAGRAMLDALRHVVIRDAVLAVDDAAFGQTATLRDLVVDVRQDGDGSRAGQAHGILAVGAITTGIGLDADWGRAESGIKLHVAVDAVNPSAIAPLAPVLARLAALDATLALDGRVVLTRSFEVAHAALHVLSGPGLAFLPKKGGGTSPGHFASLALDADGDAAALRLTGLRLVVAPPSGAPPTTVLVSGTASRDADHAVAHLHVAVDHAQMADLGAMWPVGVGGGARPWLVENVTAGSVHDGGFDLTLEAGPKLDNLTLTAATGAMPAEDVTLYWLRPVPPVEIPHVVLTLLDPDTLTLTAPGGRQGALVAKQVSMRIWGLSIKDQFSQIDGDIAAPIADVFALLAHPRLKLLSVHPLPISNPAGQSTTHLTVKLPLEAKVSMDSVDIHAVSHLTDVRIPRLAMQRPLEQGVFDADISQAGLTLNGTARLAGIPATLAVEMDFRGGPPSQIVQHVQLTAGADERGLSAIGLDTMGLLAGSIAAKLDYAEQRDGHAVLQGSADLRDARLATPLGWSKAAGPPASIEARAQLNHGRLVGFDMLRGDGPGLLVRGRSEMVDGSPSILHIERCVIGKTSLSGTIGFPLKAGDALVATLAGAQLDLAGPLSRKVTFESKTPDATPAGRPYRIDLRFDRVLVSEKAEGIGPVTLTAHGDERRIAAARLVSGGPEQVDARLEPGGDIRTLRIAVGDLGQLLRRLGAGLDMDQGVVEISGAFDDRRAGSPFSGTARVTRFGVRGLSVFGKVLQGMTLYGLVDALRGPGLVFDELTMPFTLAGSVLAVHDARAFSSSLGLTAQGQVDLGRGVIDLTGTIVPAYFFNTLPGRVPLIGRLFSPESGGGVFAATFGLHGASKDPAVTVNPLAALTPGALRGLFGLFN